MTAPRPSHVHPARIVRWVDGDTVWLDVDKDHRHRAVLNHRLLWVQAPEKRTQEGKELILWLNTIAPPGTDVVIQSYKPVGDDDDSFGRWLADLWLPRMEVSLSEYYLYHGLAEPYVGR